MNAAAATVESVVVLAAAGLLPVLAAVGRRWLAVPLAPLAGSVVAALSATAYLATGGSFVGWFLGWSLVAAAAVIAWWVRRPDRRPWVRRSDSPTSLGFRSRVSGAVGVVGVTAAGAWCLRGLRTPTVGFDARAVWLMRAGWFLQPHAQLLVDMKVRTMVLTQTAYPPLVSASTAVSWWVTGDRSARLGVTVMAVLDLCALATAALALVECGCRASRRLADGTDRKEPWLPMVAGVVAAVLVIPVAAGITEPFLTNGYADPIWSLAAVGAVAFGLQLESDRATVAAAALLILVAGLSKDEGYVAAGGLAVLVAARSVGRTRRSSTGRRWLTPIAVAVGELAVIGSWPVLMHLISARGAGQDFSTSGALASRTDAVVHGMSPYLHVLVVALPLSIVGGLVLARVRRRSAVGNDWWAWLALVWGLGAVGIALVTGQGAIEPWIRTTVHRITEYAVLEAWWIVAVWGVVATAALVRPTESTPWIRGDSRAVEGGAADRDPAGIHAEESAGVPG